MNERTLKIALGLVSVLLVCVTFLWFNEKGNHRDTETQLLLCEEHAKPSYKAKVLDLGLDIAGDAVRKELGID